MEQTNSRYIVITSKHHDGYSMWPSKYSVGWNSMALGPRRDIIGELGTAIKNKTSLHYGIYYSLSEWFNPLFLDDKANNFTTQEYVNTKTLPQLYELVKSYKPDVLWVDVLDKALGSYWKAQEFLAWLYNDSPVKDSVVTNDRWGYDTWCNHGGVMTCHDRFLPDQLQKKKWENVMTIDKSSFGFRRNAKLNSFLSSQDLINTFVQTVSLGGNMLMNVGPTEEGTIHPIYEERLRDIGNWLSVNNEAIKSSRPWSTQNDKLSPTVWYTKKQNVIYAIILGFESGVTLSLSAPKSDHDTQVHILGYNGPQLAWLPRLDGGMDITIPAIPYNKLPSNFAVTFKLTGLANHFDSGSHIIGKRTLH
ncbi:alpha-L-fucosidase [Patella vulgata]|uniref:alpha-L-fucosidase n=1 Tax=Patella vulgata TaxID=6465 RepID=UPI0024A8E3F1|nr:alpha-L-fucosidase [Patella vulgata]